VLRLGKRNLLRRRFRSCCRQGGPPAPQRHTPQPRRDLPARSGEWDAIATAAPAIAAAAHLLIRLFSVEEIFQQRANFGDAGAAADKDLRRSGRHAQQNENCAVFEGDYDFVHLPLGQTCILRKSGSKRGGSAISLQLHAENGGKTCRTLSTGSKVFLKRSRQSSSNLARVIFSLKSFPFLKSEISTVAST
jgi:hypothetical protein